VILVSCASAGYHRVNRLARQRGRRWSPARAPHCQWAGTFWIYTYTRIVFIAIRDESLGRALELLMASVFRNEFLDKFEAEAEARGYAVGLARAKAKGEARGQALGRAKGILIVLAARGVTVPAKIRDQVLACTDIAQLDAWVSKAAIAETVDEVFGEAKGNR